MIKFNIVSIIDYESGKYICQFNEPTNVRHYIKRFQ